MPKITAINTPAKSPRKRSVHLDGKWAFNVNATVAAKMKLEVGKELTDAQVAAIQGAEVQQKAFDKALAILSKRLHSRAELEKKLAKAEYSPEQIAQALDELTRLGYIDDERFAKAKAHAAAEYRKHGRRRAYVELIKAGVDKETARKANEDVYDAHDSLKVARELAIKKAPGLRKLDMVTAKRRLLGMLLRRGFTYEEVKPVMDEVLGGSQEAEPAVDSRTGEVAEAAAEAEPMAKAPEPAAAGEEEEEGPEETAEEPGNWRDSLLSHHHRRNEKPKSKWGNRSSQGKSSFGRSSLGRKKKGGRE